MKTKVIVKSKHGWDIPAIVTIPEYEGKVPFVVMIHGTASDKNEVGNGYELFADELAKHNIASIRYDAVGNGESGEDYTNYTMTKNVDDCISCLEYMQTLDTVEKDKAGLLGWSQGGTIALLASCKHPSIKSIVTWAGAVSLTSLNEDQYEEAKQNGYAVWTFDFRGPLHASIDWYEESRNIDTLSYVKPFKGALLACAGTIDDIVPPTDTKLIYDASTSDTKDIYLVEGADHIYNILTGDLSKFMELTNKTIQWFEKTL